MSSADYPATESELKAKLRHSLLSSRPQSSAGITERLIRLVTASNARWVGCYVSRADEPDTLPFLEWALREGIEICTPAVDGDLLRWRKHLGGLNVGQFGIGESTGAEIAASKLELLFIPALAATPTGHRLGRGGGYFDRFLEELRHREQRPELTVAAIVFEKELLNSLPTEAHDQPVDFVVTPSQIIRCNPENSIEEI